MSNISTLFLDIGGVLLTNGWDHHMRCKAAENFHLDAEDMNDRHHMTFVTNEVGKMTFDRYLDLVVFHQPREFSRQEFREFIFAQSQPFQETIDFFSAFKLRRGLRVAAVSNEGRDLTEYRVRKFKLGKLVDFFICSSFVHYRKPDEDIYRLALDTAQAKPHEVVYVDDRKMFVEVASDLGIRSIHHISLEATRAKLEEYIG